MRSVLVCGWLWTALLTSLLGLATAQQTNFANGPQYLVPPGHSALWAQPIATPTMAVEGTYPNLQVGAENATAGNIAGARTSTFDLEPEPDLVDLFSVYYGYAPLYFIVSGEEEYAPSAVPTGPAGMRLGAGRITTMHDLQWLGYGVTLGEAGRYWKSHPQHAKRVFTNADVERVSKSD